MTPLVVVAGTVFVVGLLLALARKMIPGHTKQPHHDVASALFSMVGVLYAVILAFVVIVVWEHDSKAGDDTQVEANDVARLYFTARALPEPQRTELMGLARDYAGTVAGDEWRLMADGRSSPKARELVSRMRVSAQGLKPVDGGQEILMANSLDAINDLVDARRERTGALESPVPPLMWAGLVVGSLITIGFTFFFDHSRLLPHLIMVCSMAALMSFILWLVYDMSLPFSGTLAIGPDAFGQIVQRFKEFPP